MKFISLAIIAILLSGCAVGPQTSKERAVTPEATPKATTEEQTASPVSSVLPEGPATPNPYLQHAPSVSRAAQQKFDAAIAAMQQQQWPQAERLLTELTRTHSNLSGVHLNLGLIYRAQKDNTKAEAAFEQAINANKRNLDAYNQLAILKRQAGDFSSAERLYQSALTVWPYHPDSHKNLAILYDLYLGREKQALAHYLAYQQLVGDADPHLKSWIADLQRRLPAASGD